MVGEKGVTVADELLITYVISHTTNATVWPLAPSLRVQTRTGESVADVLTIVSDFIAETRLLPRLADRADPEAALRGILVRWSVSRLERTLADLPASSGNQVLTIAYCLLLDPQARFVDLGADFHDRLHPQRRTHQLIRELEHLSGKKVTLHTAA